MKKMIPLILIAALGACTTVKTFDGNGNVTGKCRVVGFPFIINGHCEGNANGGRGL